MAFRSAGKLAVRLAQTTGAFASGRAYIQRYFPPGYREPATKLVTAFEQAAAGAGLYQVYQTFLSDDGTDHGNGFPQKKFNVPNKFNQTRSGRFRRTNKYPKRFKNCKCGTKCRKCGFHSR